LKIHLKTCAKVAISSPTSTPKKHSCKNCQLEFSYDDLTIHIKDCRKCNQCEQICSSKDELNKHFKTCPKASSYHSVSTLSKAASTVSKAPSYTSSKAASSTSSKAKSNRGTFLSRVDFDYDFDSDADADADADDGFSATAKGGNSNQIVSNSSSSNALSFSDSEDESRGKRSLRVSGGGGGGGVCAGPKGNHASKPAGFKATGHTVTTSAKGIRASKPAGPIAVSAVVVPDNTNNKTKKHQVTDEQKQNFTEIIDKLSAVAVADLTQTKLIIELLKKKPSETIVMDGLEKQYEQTYTECFNLLNQLSSPGKAINAIANQYK
jgi:ubiquitin